MKTRRDFLKSLAFASVGLGLNNRLSFITNTIASVDTKTLPENFCPSWSRTIFCQFDHYPLKKELEQCAKEIDCDLFFGEPASPDILAIPSFVQILDRNIVGDNRWHEYVEFCDEAHDDGPCIIVDNRDDLPLPSTKFVGLFRHNDPQAISMTISVIKQIKYINDRIPPTTLKISSSGCVIQKYSQLDSLRCIRLLDEDSRCDYI